MPGAPSRGALRGRCAGRSTVDAREMRVALRENLKRRGEAALSGPQADTRDATGARRNRSIRLKPYIKILPWILLFVHVFVFRAISSLRYPKPDMLMPKPPHVNTNPRTQKEATE